MCRQSYKFADTSFYLEKKVNGAVKEILLTEKKGLIFRLQCNGGIRFSLIEMIRPTYLALGIEWCLRKESKLFTQVTLHLDESLEKFCL